MIAAPALMHARENGREVATPFYVVAFEGERPNETIQVIEAPPQNLSVRVWNFTNRLMGE